MYGYVLQDWITIRGSATLTDVVQGENDWMGFSSFQDIVFWVDIREVTNPTSGAINLSLETAPTKDDILFQAMQTITGITTGVTLKPNILSAAGTTVPLATWVRWRLHPTGSSTQPWDVTFRVLAAANRVVRGQVA